MGTLFTQDPMFTHTGKRLPEIAPQTASTVRSGELSENLPTRREVRSRERLSERSQEKQKNLLKNGDLKAPTRSATFADFCAAAEIEEEIPGQNGMRRHGEPEPIKTTSNRLLTPQTANRPIVEYERSSRTLWRLGSYAG
jgi:hypothetical protein